MVANPSRGQLNRENEYSPVPVRVPESLVSRDGFSRPVPRQPAHLHTQARPEKHATEPTTAAGIDGHRRQQRQEGEEPASKLSPD